jgi:membrane-bound lytic murein transglycosylase F
MLAGGKGRGAMERAIDEAVAEHALHALPPGGTAMPVADQTELLAGLRHGRWNVAVGLLWPEDVDLPPGLIGIDYAEAPLVQLCGPAAEQATPWLPDELAHWDRLAPGLPTHRKTSGSAQEMAEAVHAGMRQCALLPADLAERWQRYAPGRLRIEGTDLGLRRLLAYRSDSPGLGRALASALADPALRERMNLLRVRHLATLEPRTLACYRTFHRLAEQRLPRYKPLFREAAVREGLSWQLLAALAYQESHWDPQALSPTGVRGLMMLTRRTAAELGVADRTDPRQSVPAAARYLARLVDRYADHATDGNQVWLALAAYNMGARGLAGVQARAREQGLDPWRWADLRPLMQSSSNAKWREAGDYVERIRDYLDILEQIHPRTA